MNTRKLATIRQISNIRPIDGADMIECAVVDGWQCVIAKKDNFKAGDLIIYCEIDSVMPPRPEFEFLEKYHYRIKTQKLRGQISQGLVLPIEPYLGKKKYEFGTDVTEELGIKKYQSPEEISMRAEPTMKQPKNKILKYFMRFGLFRKFWAKFIYKPGPKIRDSFPDWIPKTDEERIQNMPRLLEDIQANKPGFVATEKLDGTSATYYLKRDGEFGICSRNYKLLIPNGTLAVYFEINEKYKLKEKMGMYLGKHPEIDSVVLQGEIYGSGIQKNKYGLNVQVFRVFNVLYRATNSELSEFHIQRFSYDEITEALNEMNSLWNTNYKTLKEFSFSPTTITELDLKQVPLICTDESEDPFPMSSFAEMEAWVKKKKHHPEPNLVVQDEEKNNKSPIEGVVVRSRGADSTFSFKYINPFFLLKYDE